MDQQSDASPLTCWLVLTVRLGTTKQFMQCAFTHVCWGSSREDYKGDDPPRIGGTIL